MRMGQNLNLGMLPQRIARCPQVRHSASTKFPLNWGDASKVSHGFQPLATLEATDVPGKEEEFCFETPAPTLSWPSPQHLVNGSTMARWSSDKEGCSLAATMEAETLAMDEGEQAADHARDPGRTCSSFPPTSSTTRGPKSPNPSGPKASAHGTRC